MRSNRFPFVMVALIAGTLAGSVCRAHAQGEIVPAEDGRFYIDLQDAPLSDALEMIFKAAGNPSHYIDPSLKGTNIGTMLFTNVSWHSAIMQLANQNNCRFYKNQSGSYVVEPREPVATAGTPGAGGMPGMGVMPGGLPSNPFSTRANGLAGVSTEISPQERPAARARAPKIATDAADDDEDKSYHIVPVNHVYVGGISRLFKSGKNGAVGIIGSEQFLIPESATSGGGLGGNRGSSGFGGGNTGFGGMGSSFGGGSQGFGSTGSSFGGQIGGSYGGTSNYTGGTSTGSSGGFGGFGLR